jgi:hypothetical protein
MIVLGLIYGICYELVVVMNMMNKLFVVVVRCDFFFWIMLISVLSLYFLVIITAFFM